MAKLILLLEPKDADDHSLIGRLGYVYEEFELQPSGAWTDNAGDIVGSTEIADIIDDWAGAK